MTDKKTTKDVNSLKKVNNSLSTEEQAAYSEICAIATIGKKQLSPPTAGVVRFSRVARENCIRVLLSIASGVSMIKAMERYNLNWTDINILRAIDNEFRNALAWAEEQKRHICIYQAEHLTERALKGEDVTTQQARIAQFILERLDKSNYSREVINSSGSSGSAGTVININISNPDMDKAQKVQPIEGEILSDIQNLS